MANPNDETPRPPNCRCVIIVNTELPWQVEIHDLLDLVVGDTDPTLRAAP